VDDIFFFEGARTRSVSSPSIGVLYNTDPLKGWNDAVPALRLLRQRLPHVAVRAFGQMPMLQQHQLDNLTFEMRPAQRRIAELARSVDVWFLPSVKEGFGLPAIEAAAAGTPMVATRSGGPPDYVRHGENGFLVDARDREGMAHALHEVLTCDAARWQSMSAAAKQTAETFRWAETFAKFERALTDG
jgi:glycosyltransferase involved in cell wall biosynthesis